MEEYICNLFFSPERYLNLITFVVYFFFTMLAAIFIVRYLIYEKCDRYLAKNHYKVWKLTKGTLDERKKARLPKPCPFIDNLIRKQNKIRNLLLGVWLVISVLLALAVVIIDKLQKNY